MEKKHFMTLRRTPIAPHLTMPSNSPPKIQKACSACVLVLFVLLALCLCIVGYMRYHTVDTTIDTRYEQARRDRLEVEEKILGAMNLYREASQKVYEQEMKLKQLLEGKPVAETIDLFSKSNIGEIPPDLRSAYSIWRGLLPDERQMVQIDKWLERQVTSGLLEDLDEEIKEFENRRQLEPFLSPEELARFDEMRARTQQVLKENVFSGGGLSLEEEVIKNQKERWADWK